MKKIAVIFVAALLTGCGQDKTTVPATPHSDTTDAKAIAARPSSEKTEAKPTPLVQKKPKWQGYPRLSPFEAVRWRESIPEVWVKGVWYELLSLNGISSQEIVAFCKSVEKRDWQKRFEEDLVEVLSPLVSTQVRHLD